MEMKDFVTRAYTLKNYINVGARGFSGMGIPVYCCSIEENQIRSDNVTLDEKYKEIDALIEECKVLIGRYEQIYDIISENGAGKAGEKSKSAARITSIEAERSNIAGEMDRLVSQINYFEKREKECSQEDKRLREVYEEIKKREKSGMEFVPFYGIAYVCTTNQMIGNYNRDVARNNVVREQINHDKKAYFDNRNQLDALKRQMNELTAEMDVLRIKYGEILEALDILNYLIKSMGDFITAMGKTKSALQYSFFENINQAQTAIDQALNRIESYHDVFCRKLKEISGKLDGDDYNKIVKLAG